MNDNTITGVMGLGRLCERCGGTGTVHNGPWVVCCPECDGDGFYHEPEDLSDQPEPDFNQLERDEAARLDAIEDEADLKAYYAEQGDDAPEPQPDANSRREEYYRIAAFERAEFQSLNADLHAQLATARATQNQLRDALVAVTAERDALKKRVEVQSGTIYKLGKSWDFDREKLKDAEQRAALGDPEQFEAQALKSEIVGLEFMVERFKTALEKINELALQIVQSAPAHEFTPIVAKFGLTAHEALAPIPDDDTE